MNIRLSMDIDIDDNSFDEFKKLEHHIDHLIDLSEWKEIKSISNVQVEQYKDIYKKLAITCIDEDLKEDVKRKYK